MAFNEDSSGSGHDEPWIQWFCGLKGHEMFCEVERSYIEDGFNLYGLRACVSNFSDCLDLILDRIGPDDSDDSHLTQSACTLYGLIHARYIITAHGLDAMYNKYAAKEFGTCPLAQCQGQPVLPVGLKDEMGTDTVKIFCPKCQCVYHPPPIRSRSSSHHGAGAAGVDGAAFGTTFPHLFLMTFSNLVPDPLPPNSAYVPRVFGFRVHMSARQRTPSNSASAAGDTAGKSSTKSSRLGYSRKSSSQAAGAAAAAAAANEAMTKPKEDDQDAKPAAAKAAKAAIASGSTAAASTAAKNPPGESKPGADNNDGKEDAGKNAKPRAGGSSKRRPDGDDGIGKSKEGNGFLIDNSSKRRKRDATG